MIESLRAAIIEYEREALTDPTAADPTKLEKYIEEAEQDLRQSQMAPEAVHNAFGLYVRLKDRERRLEVLESYLDKELTPEEEAWARWSRVMALATPRRCHAAVEAHEAFLSWAREALDADRLFWVMGAGALCWFEVGRGDDWLELFQELNDSIAATEGNRYHRFLCCRTAARALARLERTKEARTIAEDMLTIAIEDPEWDYRLYTEMSAYAAFVHIHSVAGETVELKSVAAQATQRLEEFAAGLPKPESLKKVSITSPPGVLSPADGFKYREDFAQRDPIIAYRGACHNLGAVLYRAKEYELALPLFERAMAYRFLWPYLAKCYAACVWVTSRDSRKVGAFVARATPVFGRNKDWWKGVPELQDLPSTI